jgi:hypothetical protein
VGDERVNRLEPQLDVEGDDKREIIQKEDKQKKRNLYRSVIAKI